MGDPSGIGAEIIAGALKRLFGLADFIVIGDRWVFEKISRIPQGCKFIGLDNISHGDFSFGKIRPDYGRASLEYLDRTMELLGDKEIDCLVTAPISKESLKKAGFSYSGHTEYLAKHSHTKDFVMMLLNKCLKISLVTRHIALKKVPLQLDREKITKTVLLTHKALRQLFLIRKPRLVICGLNPHASDNGLLGLEENRVIKPAITEARKKGISIDGPLSADVAIFKAKEGCYDSVIAIYHDQALIPLKLLDKNTGVNITLGLPFVRTSPLHGTAFDIAGKGLADPSSLIEAIKLAVKCTLNLRKA